MPIARTVKDGSHQRLHSLTVSLVVSVLLFTVFLAFQRPYFYTNDDAGIQAILCGAQTGEPNPYTIYTSYWLCRGIVCLYRAFPGVAWWFFILESLQFAALFAWCYLTDRVFRYRASVSGSYNGAYALAVVVLSGACWSYLPIVRPSYTFASASLSAIGAVLFYVAADCTWFSKSERTSFAVFSVIMHVLGCAMRYKSGIVGLAFTCTMAAVFLVRVVYRRANERGKHIRSQKSVQWIILCMVPVCSAALALGGQAMHLRAYDTMEWHAFDSLNKARSAYMDLPHDAYEDNPELYEAVGWDQYLANLVKKWFFMDRRVNEEAFVRLVEGSSTQSASPWWTIANELVTHKGIFVDGLFLSMAAIAVALCYLLQVYCTDDGWIRPLGLLVLALAICAVIYVAAMGRMIFRAAYCALLPAVFIMWFMMLEHMTTIPNKKNLRRAHVALSGFVVLIAAAMVTYWTATLGIPAHGFCLVGLIAPLVTLSFAIGGLRSNARRHVIWLTSLTIASAMVLASTQQSIDYANRSTLLYVQQVDAMTKNAQNHPETIYIYPPSFTSTDPFRSFSENVVAWGGWTYYAPWKSALFERLGYSEGLYAEAFFDENVYFVSVNKGTERDLRAYLSSIADGEVIAELVDEFGEESKVYSYSVVGVEPA